MIGRKNPGYTFTGWSPEPTLTVTGNATYTAQWSQNKYTVIYMDGETEYTRKEVNYGETVSEEVITKAHNIYIGWTIEGRVYDFSTPITQNITIQSSFELVETFAERLAALLMLEFNIPWLRLKITKPGAVASARGVGVEIERGCR